MTIINMLRGGEHNGPNGDTYSNNMYPRPDYLAEQMARNDGWENRPDSFHYVESLDLCKCWNCGAIKRSKAADSGTESCMIEVDDEFPLVWIPNRFDIMGYTLEITGCVDGVVLGVNRYGVLAGNNVVAGATLIDTPMTGLSADCIPGTTIDQAYLDSLTCNDRVRLEDFCKKCASEGCYYTLNLSAPQLVGESNVDDDEDADEVVDVVNKVCGLGGQYLSLVIEELPEDFNCGSCCLKIELGARVRVPHRGS